MLFPLSSHQQFSDSFVLQAPMEADDVGNRQFVISRAVRVVLTNYDTHKTVYALWINADEASQQPQDPSPAEPLFLRFSDETYQLSVDVTPVVAAGLARWASMPEDTIAKHRIRLNQRFRAVTGHCFYAGMSLLQVSCFDMHASNVSLSLLHLSLPAHRRFSVLCRY